MGITVIGGGSDSGADTLGTYSKTTLTAGVAQKCTLDLSTGNTFVLDDIYDFRNTVLDVTNPPASGTLGKYDVFLPADANAFATFDSTAYDSTNLIPSAISKVTEPQVETHFSLAYDFSMFFSDNGYTVHFVLNDTNQNIRRYTLDKPYDLSKDNSVNLPNGQFVSINSLAGQGLRNRLPLGDLQFSYYRLFHIDNNGTFFLFIDGSIIKKLKLTSQYSFVEPSGCEVIQSFTPTNIVDPDLAAITQDGKYLYCFDYTNRKMTNYILTNPFDLTTATYHSAATGVTDIQYTSSQIQVPSNGNRVLYNIYGSGVTAGIYTRTMSTPHNLGTLSGPIKLAADEYMARLTHMFDDETKIAGVNVNGTRSVKIFAQNYIKPSLEFSGNIFATEGVKKILSSGKATRFNLVTADGGNTFTAY